MVESEQREAPCCCRPPCYAWRKLGMHRWFNTAAVCVTSVILNSENIEVHFAKPSQSLLQILVFRVAMEPSDSCTSRWSELAQHTNLLSIAHSRHASCTSVPGRYSVTQSAGRSAAPATRACITWMRMWARMQGLLRWLLPLGAALSQKCPIPVLLGSTRCIS